MGKKNVSEIERGAGFFAGLARDLMDVAREKGVPFEAIYRLVTAGGRTTLGKIVELAHADWLEEQPEIVEPQGRRLYRGAPTNGDALPPDHYRVHVTYDPMPSMDDLKREWGKDNVSDIFNGHQFILHVSRVCMSRTPGSKVFYLHDAGDEWEPEEQIAWGLKQQNAVARIGYRPATHDETYEFAKAHPELESFVGLGSFAMHGRLLCVAHMRRGKGRRILDSSWLGDSTGLFSFRGCRVLFVCG